MFPPPPSLLAREILSGPPETLRTPTPSHLLPLCTFCGHSHTRHEGDRCELCSCDGFREPECDVCPHQRLDHPLVAHPTERDAAGDPVKVHGACGVYECDCAGYVTATRREMAPKP